MSAGLVSARVAIVAAIQANEAIEYLFENGMKNNDPCE
jgi:hypothetical protein